MAVAALRGPSYPAGENDTAARQVSRYQPPSGCGARSSCSARGGRMAVSRRQAGPITILSIDGAWPVGFENVTVLAPCRSVTRCRVTAQQVASPPTDTVTGGLPDTVMTAGPTDSPSRRTGKKLNTQVPVARA